MKNNQQLTQSPCIRNCCLDNNNICLGCFRSLHEIINWTQVNEKTQQDYLNNAHHRRMTHDPNHYLP